MGCFASTSGAAASRDPFWCADDSHMKSCKPLAEALGSITSDRPLRWILATNSAQLNPPTQPVGASFQKSRAISAKTKPTATPAAGPMIQPRRMP